MKREQAAFDVPDLKCSGCVERVQSVLGRVDGVQSASADLEAMTATVGPDLAGRASRGDREGRVLANALLTGQAVRAFPNRPRN